MTMPNDLQPLVDAPMERINVEYKNWLELRTDRDRATTDHDRAVLAKAAIAMANHGGGYIVIGFCEREGFLVSQPMPDGLSEITQDSVNSAVRRYAEPAFECGLRLVECAKTGVRHPVIVVREGMTVPVRSKSDQAPLRQYAYYIRKPGPSSEEPNTEAEWDRFLRRLVQAKKDEMLDAIRAIVDGRAGVDPRPRDTEELQGYCQSAHGRWRELVTPLPDEEPARFPHGYWEIAFSLVGATSRNDLTQIRERLEVAGRVMYNGWPVFLILNRPEMRPLAQGDDIVAWLGPPGHGRAFNDPQHCDFWSASRNGNLYLIRGYIEDGAIPVFGNPGVVLDVGLAIRRVAEALLFAGRFYAQFEDAVQIAVHCRFVGLTGRVLHDRRFDFSANASPDVCRVAEINSEALVTVPEIENNLAEVLRPLLHRVFEQFGFYDLPMGRVQAEIQEMRNQEFRER